MHLSSSQFNVILQFPTTYITNFRNMHNKYVSNYVAVAFLQYAVIEEFLSIDRMLKMVPTFLHGFFLRTL
jgi:hypothetical protein